jgi:hypothetical protein
MTYRWTPEGPAFEFPTPFATENRFRAVRSYVLMAAALLVVLVCAFVGQNDADRPVVTLGDIPEPASVWPHLAGALVLALVGLLEWLRARNQRQLVLVPGQPASLTTEIPRESTGASPGAAALTAMLAGGTDAARALKEAPTEVTGRYAAGLRLLGHRLALAPDTLHAYIRVRLANAMLLTGLLVVLGAALLVPRPAGVIVVGALLGLVAVLVVARHEVDPERDALPPWALFGLVVLAAGLAAVPLWYGNAIPRAESLQRLGVPVATALLLGSGLLFELLGLGAVRRQLPTPQFTTAPAAEVRLNFDTEVEPMMREVDLELHRRWAEGIPHRRYAWRTPQVARGQAEGPFTATVLEESQPLGPKPLPASERPRRTKGQGTLYLLDTLGVIWTAAGAALWVVLAWLHMKDSTASWMAGPAGLACLLAGGQALRVAHFLWSRVELESTLTALDMTGHFTRATPEVASRDGREPLRVHDFCVRARVAVVRSAFYADAPHRVGSRVVVSTRGDAAAAKSWVEALQGLLPAAAAQAASQRVAPAPAQPRAPAREARVSDPAAAAAAAARRLQRFCPACGTPVLQGARFCQHCGNVVAND